MSPWQCKRADRATVKFNCPRDNVPQSRIYYTFLFIVKRCNLNTLSVSDFNNCSCLSMRGTWGWASDAGCVLHFPWIIRDLFPPWLICPLPLPTPPCPHFGAFGGKNGAGHPNRMECVEKPCRGKCVREGTMNGSGYNVSGKKMSKTEFLGNTFFSRRMIL